MACDTGDHRLAAISQCLTQNGWRARAKVSKSVCERTFTGARGNDKDAPKAKIRSA
jgi:hypothetical protein